MTSLADMFSQGSLVLVFSPPLDDQTQLRVARRFQKCGLSLTSLVDIVQLALELTFVMTLTVDCRGADRRDPTQVELALLSS